MKAMMRVKNEARWLTRVLSGLEHPMDPWDIFLLDDNSSDETAQLAKDFGCTVLTRTERPTDETRDKNELLDALAADTLSPIVGEWIVCIDGDEIITDWWKMYEAAERADPSEKVLTARILYAWDSEQRIRWDGLYSRFNRPSAFRWREGLRFQSTNSGGNLHCSNTPYGSAWAEPTFDIVHLGYLHKEDRIRKYHWYNSIDPNNTLEDMYRHIVAGDLFPAEQRMLHAGPMHFITLDEAKGMARS